MLAINRNNFIRLPGLILLFLLFFSCRQEVEPDNKMNTIKYIERASGEIKQETVPGKGMLKWLYSSATGKAALHLLVKRKAISEIGGWYMDTKMSAKRIPGFIAEHHINIDEFQNAGNYKTFNQFFYRKLKSGARTIQEGIISPADGKILVFPSLKDVRSFFIKGSEFSLDDFLLNGELAQKYKDGAMAIVRLAPPDYHRYHFPATGEASESIKIKGHYFSVSPLALRKSLEIFCQNKREYCTLATDDFGKIIIVDIGATMVGSIIQTYQTGQVKKGDEKGYFAFGGSTLVLLFEKDRIKFDADLIKNTREGLETSIAMGEQIASK